MFRNAMLDLKAELIPFENTPENAREILSNPGMQIYAVAGIYDENIKDECWFRIVRLEDKKVSFAVTLIRLLAIKRNISLYNNKARIELKRVCFKL